MFRKCDLELKEHAVCKEKITRCFFWQRIENDVDKEDDSLYGACVSPSATSDMYKLMIHSSLSSSTSNIRVALGGMTPG